MVEGKAEDCGSVKNIKIKLLFRIKIWVKGEKFNFIGA
jgi:hypothetical protein